MLKPLSCEANWPIWKRKMRDLFDHHENALVIVEKKLLKRVDPGDALSDADKKIYSENLSEFRKGNCYAKSLISATVTDEIYQKIMTHGFVC